MRRREAYDILRAVRDEQTAARFSLEQTLRVLDNDLNAARGGERVGVRHGEIRRCARNLEVTYVIRLFSEFKGFLLSYWQQALGKVTRPKASILIDRIADQLKMSDEHRAGAHEVRDYRNDVIHEQLRDARLTLQQCATHLGRFLSWLPEAW